MRNHNLYIKALPVTLCILIVFPFISIAQKSSANVFPLEKIQEGMKGKAYTVFKGDTPTEYDVEVIGRIPNGIGTGADMLLLRLYGADVERTEVFHGMSGSPVFIDGKLAASISFSMGLFPKEVIAGATPAQYILDNALPLPQMAKTAKKIGAFSLKPVIAADIKLNDNRFNDMLKTESDINSTFNHYPGFTTKSSLPLTTAGIDSSILETYSSFFEHNGFKLITNNNQSAIGEFHSSIPSAAILADSIDVTKNTPLKPVPGSVIYIPLIRGDFSIGGSGTLTYVDGDDIFAFGHEMYNLGSIDIPVHSAKILTVYASEMSSFHIAVPGDEIGVLKEDHITGVYGKLYEKAHMVPVEIQIRNKGTLMKKYNMEISQGRFFPILLLLANRNAMIRSFDLGGVSTCEVNFYFELENEDIEPVATGDLYSGENALANASILPAAAAYFLMINNFTEVRFGQMRIQFDFQQEQKSAEIIRVKYNKSKLSAGEYLDLMVYLRTWRGKTIVKKLSYRIPESYPEGNIKVVIGNADYITGLENRAIGKTPLLNNLKHLIRLINSYKPGDTIYVQFQKLSEGVFTKGRFLSELPPSAYKLFTSKDTNEDIINIQTALLNEDRITTEYFVEGHQIIDIEIVKKNDLEIKEKK